MAMLIQWIYILIFASMHTYQATSSKKLKILVLGGNGFMGAETVDRLLSQGHEVTTINRGNWYWDSETRIKPFVTNIICDRSVSLSECKQLQSFQSNRKENAYFDFVIDFSTYYSFQMTDVLETFSGQIGKYIYISSDSVYEVCVKNHDGYTVESDAVRPTNETVRQELNTKDEYGDGKLAAEEALKIASVPYLMLRLPDVIGPRDNTFRWWIYQLWMKLSPHLAHQVTIPKRLFYKPLSFVYVRDVADVILRSLNFSDEVYDEAYNLAFSETPTLYELLSKIRSSLEKENINILLDERHDYMYLFPSVTLGPVNIDKAKKRLEWKPTPFETAAEETIMFYEDAITNKIFKKEADKVIENVRKYFTEDSSEVDRGLIAEYQIMSYHIKEDL